MYNDLINSNVTVVVSSKGDTILEYKGTLISENENNIALADASINYLMLNFQKGFFGSNINQYKQNIEKIIINKEYIISCDR